jgi:hypothetical protein
MNTYTARINHKTFRTVADSTSQAVAQFAERTGVAPIHFYMTVEMV